MADHVDDEATCTAVAALLRRCGMAAAAQDTGGGTWCVVIPDLERSPGEPAFVFGTAGACWEAEVAGTRGGLATDVPAGEVSREQVAQGILAALGRFLQGVVGEGPVR